MKSKRKKVKFIFVAIASSLIILSISNASGIYQPSYQIINEENGAYATYREGNVYIGSEEFLSAIDKKNGDVLVLDEREIKNNIKIIDSYKITSSNNRMDIINIIQDYENNDPTSWDRSPETMQAEWCVHNVLYGFFYKRDHTKDVDFENNEESIYNRKILKKIFK